jgi:hypothetical protein
VAFIVICPHPSEKYEPIRNSRTETSGLRNLKLPLRESFPCEELPHFLDHLLTYFLHSFVLIQKNEKIKAMNRLSVGFSSTRHHLNGPSSSSTIIKETAGVKCCQSVAENTLQLRQGISYEVLYIVGLRRTGVPANRFKAG